MKNLTTLIAIAGASIAATSSLADIQLINNGGFESGLSGWTVANQFGSEGTFSLQSGTLSPVNGLGVQPPSQGIRAAMSDGGGPGSHVLYQDFLIPSGVTQATLSFSLFVNNTADAFTTPSTLDFATPALNQQARVDITTSTADPFSVASADVLQNVFQTTVGSPLTTGYNVFNINVSSLLAARGGQTLRLRFAEVDNVNIFNFGIDDVNLTVPTPATLLILTPVAFIRRRR